MAGMHDLNGTTLADVLGLSRPAVSDLMTGKRSPSLPTLLTIQQVFGIGSQLASEPLDVLLPRLADPERFRATVQELATRPGDVQRQRSFQAELFSLQRGKVQPSTKRGKR
jgi:transcriptional regulator with XRE-family HTH domain